MYKYLIGDLKELLKLGISHLKLYLYPHYIQLKPVYDLQCLIYVRRLGASTTTRRRRFLEPESISHSMDT